MVCKLIACIDVPEYSIFKGVAYLDDLEDPAAMPVFWISKWVDYSDKYGLGYQLCDNSVGVVYNDNTKLVMDAAGG